MHAVLNYNVNLNINLYNALAQYNLNALKQWLCLQNLIILANKVCTIYEVFITKYQNVQMHMQTIPL